jgi:hypothetical protein
MNPNRAIALLTIASLPVIAWGSAATAQTVNISHLQTNLQAAVCLNDWPGALRAIAPLIGSPGITSAYRQDLIQFRHQLEGWRAAQSEFTNVPGCSGAVQVTTSPSNDGFGQSLDWYRAVESLEESRSVPADNIRLGF